jgi:CheY-like chemotaxis protein
MNFEFCWEHNKCDRSCPVKETQSIFCWRIAQKESLCHPDFCRKCSYRSNWFSNKYDLQEFIRSYDKKRGRPKARRILAIDDEPNFLFALEETVQSLSYNCLTAIDGEEGLFFATQSLPDLIITDINMPRLGGFDLCRALKSDPRTAAIPIIIVSVRGSQKDIDQGLAAGASAYLVKPLKPHHLVRHVRDLIPGEQSESRR